MKLLFEFFPIILFFAAFKFKGIYVATAAAIAASLCQLAWAWLRNRKIEPMLWVNAGVLLVFGGMTLLFHNVLFIKWKPTILYWVFAAALAVSRYAFGKNFIRTMLQKSISAPDRVWDRLNLSWVLFFAGLGGLNLFIAYRYPLAAWVNFKLFGALGCMIAFIVIQSVILARYVQQPAEN